MAGPVASILLRDALSAEMEATVRLEVRRTSSRFEGEDFWIQGRLFTTSFQPEPCELAELISEGIAGLAGWEPRALVRFSAGRNDSMDHYLLGEICVRIARLLGGLVDFGGALLPPIGVPVLQVFGSNWSEWAPYLTK